MPMIPCGWYPNTYGRSAGRSHVFKKLSNYEESFDEVPKPEESLTMQGSTLQST